MVRGIGNNYGIAEQTDYQRRLVTAKGMAELAALGGAIYGADKFIAHKYGVDAFRPSEERINAAKAGIKESKDMGMNLVKKPFSWMNEKLGKFGAYNTVSEKLGIVKDAVKSFFNENVVGKTMKTVAGTPGSMAKKVGNWAMHLPGPLKAVGFAASALIAGKVVHDRAFNDGVGKTVQLFSMMDETKPRLPQNDN